MEFSQAARVREKINKLTELKISKMAIDIKKMNEQQIQVLREERESELALYKSDSDEQKKEIEDKGNQMVNELDDKHNNEIHSYNENFKTTFPSQNPSSTKAILDLNKKLDVVVKKKE